MNVMLRGIALGAKFALTFALARFLEPADVGLYGLVFATTTYLQFALGLDFYVYANRELIGADRHVWTNIMRDQGVFVMIAYVVVLPLCLALFVLDFLPWAIAAWFFALLILEHIGHELSRLLIAMSRPVLATVLLFLRAGAWVLVLIPAMWLNPAMRTLEYVFISWTAGAACSCLLGAVAIARIGRWDVKAPVDWRWIVRGIGVSIPLLVATLALRGLSTFDRYWIEAIGGLQALAAYVLFVGVANAIRAFLDAGVFVFGYPGLIKAARAGDEAAFRAGMRNLAWQALLVTAGLAITALVLIGPLLAWIDRPVYREHVELLYWTVLGVVLYAAGMVFHYGIYAHNRDAAIVRSHVTGLAIFVVSVEVLRPWLDVLAVPVSVCVAYASILIWKALTFFRTQPLNREAALNQS
jgi:O-antigen/teichoic acid export membrane protein